MNTVEILGLTAALAAPLGFAVSLIAAIALTTGRSRALSAAALGLGLACIGLLTYAESLPYSAGRRIEGLSALTALGAIVTIYLRYAYFPSTLRWINRPATLGLLISFGASAVFILIGL